MKIVFIIIGFALMAGGAFAQPKIGGDVGKFFEQVKKADPGLQALKAVSEGKDPGKAVGKALAAQTRLVIKTATTAAATDDAIEQAIFKNLGPDAKAVLIARLPEKISAQASIIGLKYVARTLDGKPPTGKEIGVIPLTAALQQAINHYKASPDLKPIPSGVQYLLASYFSKDLLKNAHFVIDSKYDTLPAAINGLQEVQANEHAVTVGNIIVFSQDPGIANIFFWAHEMAHVEQYSKLGIDGFAEKYATNWKDLEADADKVAQIVYDRSVGYMNILEFSKQ